MVGCKHSYCNAYCAK